AHEEPAGAGQGAADSADAADDGPRALPALRHVLLAGEPLYGADVLRWRARAGAAHPALLYNLYGPTETTLAKACYRVPPGARPAPNKVLPVGQPLPQTALLILSEDGALCPIGEIGEICIRTPFRTRGYLHDPARTAEVFVRNPLDPEGDAIYRTGDLGRYLPDRAVECLGRRDHQLKVNGVRVEPAEIEIAARRVDGVAEAVVVGHRGAARQIALSCYYTRRDDAPDALSNETLRAALARTLPPRAMPAFFIQLDELPKTISGKIARKQLPKPEALLYQQRAYVAPEGDTETQLAAIWSQVLGLRQISADHPFVELGGDSLKAIRVTAAIYRAFDVEITLQQLFGLRTVRALATAIDDAAQAEVASIPRVDDAASYPASHAQTRLWTLDQMEADAVAYNLPLAFDLRGPLDAARLQRAFDALIARHEALRTVFAFADGALRQIVRPPAPFALVRADLRGYDDPHAMCASRLAAERRTPFDLTAGPLLRGELLQLGDDLHVLAFTIHHIICDVWSLEVMVDELDALYRDPDAALPPLAIQVRDATVWQHARLADGALDGSRDFWRARFADGGPPPLALPTDARRPTVQTFRGATATRALSDDARAGLDALTRQLDASAFVVAQAALKVLLHRLTDARDVVVGTPVVGREHPDLARQIGLYVNTLALRDTLDPALAFDTLVGQVARTTADAVAHQGYPFDRLVEDLDLRRDDLSRSPLFDVMLVVQEMSRPIQLDGLETTNHAGETQWTTSRFDQVFHLMPDGDGWQLDVNYNVDLFSAQRIDRLAAGFDALLASA
ncbi:MAG: condensation domain-containing protein, partial [Acidobacteriota bacterium]